MKRRWKVAWVVVVVVLVGLFAANGVVTSVLERRLSARATEAIGKPVRVDLHGWPAPVRLLFGGLPRADAATEGGPVAATPVRRLDASVHDLDLGVRSLLGGPPVSLAATRLDLDLAFREKGAPLGMSQLEVVLTGLSGRLGRGATGTLLSAADARLVAEDLSLPESPAELAMFRVRLSDARLIRQQASGRDLLVVESQRATFEATLTEEEVNRAWTAPGRVRFLPGVARLMVGPVAVDVDVGVSGGEVVLTPRVPPALRALVGDAPQLAFAPALPLGAQMEAIEVRSGEILLRGSATRLEVPLSTAPS